MSDNKSGDIPDEAVEAAAKAVRAGLVQNVVRFDELARAALEAAAPHIRAQALEDAADAWQVRMDTIGRGTVEAKTFMQRRAQADRPTK